MCSSSAKQVESGELILEGQLLHEEVHSGVHLKAMKVVGISLQPHEEASIRHIGRAGRIKKTTTEQIYHVHRTV